MKINWKVRFNKANIQFIVRFVAALLIPILAYMGLKMDDVTSWPMLGNILMDFISNPYLIALTFYSAFNVIPDPTTAGLSDSKLAMQYIKPRNDKDFI